MAHRHAGISTGSWWSPSGYLNRHSAGTCHMSAVLGRGAAEFIERPFRGRDDWISPRDVEPGQVARLAVPPVGGCAAAAARRSRTGRACVQPCAACQRSAGVAPCRSPKLPANRIRHASSTDRASRHHAHPADPPAAGQSRRERAGAARPWPSDGRPPGR